MVERSPGCAWANCRVSSGSAVSCEACLGLGFTAPSKRGGVELKLLLPVPLPRSRQVIKQASSRPLWKQVYVGSTPALYWPECINLVTLHTPISHNMETFSLYICSLTCYPLLSQMTGTITLWTVQWDTLLDGRLQWSLFIGARPRTNTLIIP